MSPFHVLPRKSLTVTFSMTMGSSMPGIAVGVDVGRMGVDVAVGRMEVGICVGGMGVGVGGSPPAMKLHVKDVASSNDIIKN